jgi:hypothetical protein
MVLTILHDRLLYFNPGAVLNASRANEYQLFVRIHLFGKEDRINRLTDFSHLQKVDLGDTFRQSVEIIRHVLSESLGSAKAAIFSSRPLGLDMADFCETAELQVMDTLQEALEYLEAADLLDDVLLNRLPDR